MQDDNYAACGASIYDGSAPAFRIVVMMDVPGNFEIEAADYCDVVYAKYEKTKVVFVKR